MSEPSSKVPLMHTKTAIKKPKKFSPLARKKARQRALQALYQWQMSDNTLSDIETQFLQDNEWKKVDVSYFGELLHGIPKHLSQLDEALQQHMTRSMDSIDPIERAILRIAAFELLERLEIPYKVIINESVDLAKMFGATDGHKFVNGVVDKVSIDHRPHEIQKQSR